MMNAYKAPLSLRWSDIDPNLHVRHSIYYDFAAQMRVEALNKLGVDLHAMQKGHFGPILFREECIFKREIRMGDKTFISMAVKKLRRDFSRFSIQHEITREDGTLCAIIHIDGAWIDTLSRKLTVPPQFTQSAMDAMPKTDDFMWEDVKG